MFNVQHIQKLKAMSIYTIFSGPEYIDCYDFAVLKPQKHGFTQTENLLIPTTNTL